MMNNKNFMYFICGTLAGIVWLLGIQNMHSRERPIVKERGFIEEMFQPYFISVYQDRTEIYLQPLPCGPQALPGKLSTTFLYVDKENDGNLDYKKNLLNEIKDTLISPSDFWQKEYLKFQKNNPEIYNKNK